MSIKSIKHAVILAAGRGVRMRPLTDKMPKAMAPLKGSTLIANGIKALKKYIPNIYITVGHKGSMLASHVIENDVSAVFNTNNQGNAWWIFNTILKEIKEPIVVLTCDNVVKMDFNKIISDYENFNSPHCMLVPTSPIQGIDGDYISHDKNNLITNLSRDIKSNLYSSGIQILNIQLILQDIKETYDFKSIWSQLIVNKQLYCGYTQPNFWYSVDNTNQLKIINNK